MTDRPILFSAPMVRSLLAGTKTQTRRVLGRLRRFGVVTEFGPTDTRGYDWHFRDPQMRWHDLRHPELLKALPWQVGDRLYLREAWRTFISLDDTAPRDLWSPEQERGAGIYYEAGGNLSITKGIAGREWLLGDGEMPAGAGRFRQGMHMPRWASRLTLTVTEVRVQRVQEISGSDAEAEGIFLHVAEHSLDKIFRGERSETAINRYSELWDSLNADRGFGWSTNPWVTATSFSVARSNIDEDR